MAWTQNRSRGRGLYRRHCPGLEALDDRCLLSTSAGAAALHHSLVPHRLAAVHARSAQAAVLDQHGSARFPKCRGPRRAIRSAVCSTRAPGRNRDDRSPDRLRPDRGRRGGPLDLRRERHGHDGGGHRHRRGLQESALGGAFGPGAKVIAGYNFATNTPDPMATTSQHGTAVAGLIGSSDPNHLGVAPGVNIVALKVVGDNNTAEGFYLGDVLVVRHHRKKEVSLARTWLGAGPTCVFVMRRASRARSCSLAIQTAAICSPSLSVSTLMIVARRPGSRVSMLRRSM